MTKRKTNICGPPCPWIPRPSNPYFGHTPPTTQATPHTPTTQACPLSLACCEHGLTPGYLALKFNSILPQWGNVPALLFLGGQCWAFEIRVCLTLWDHFVTGTFILLLTSLRTNARHMSRYKSRYMYVSIFVCMDMNVYYYESVKENRGSSPQLPLSQPIPSV